MSRTDSRPSVGRRRGPVRVAIAHPHRTFAEALRLALSRPASIRVAVVAHDVGTLLADPRLRHVDVVLLDEDLIASDAETVTAAIKRAAPRASVLLLADGTDDAALVRAIVAGADGVVSTASSLRDVARSVQAAGAGAPLIDPELSRRVALRVRRRREERASLRERMGRLTPREIEILQMMADGLSPDEAADQLGISRHTLRTHMQNVLMKLQMHSKLQAVTAAIRYGVVRVREAVEPEPRRVIDLTAIESPGAGYGAGTTGSTSGARSGHGRSRGS